MKKLYLLLMFSLPSICYGQFNFQQKYMEAENAIKENKIEEAYLKLKELEQELPQTDSLYVYVLWNQVQVVTHLEQAARLNQDFEKSLRYGLEALEFIKMGTLFFDDEFGKREFFMIKNLVVSNVALGRYEEAKRYKEKLYLYYGEGRLPEGIDEYFNIDYFKWGDKNVWGYEWYAELPKDRFSSSFTKVVYYVYSTLEDGSDDQQLYRLHVLMFHGEDASFDYVLTKYLDTAQDESHGTLYAYTYNEEIDFEKLHKDVIRVLEGKAQADFEKLLETR